MSDDIEDTAIVSFRDIMDEDELREALSVLGGSDPEHCSYTKGYVKRQAVFACSTCTPTGVDPGGLCLACANICHDGHDIFELYTKRQFRCDCGNDKFGDFNCQLNPTKDSLNLKNKYNHNFCGKYCSCDRPYPDADDQVDDEMIQCIICEDWYHTRHLGCAVVDSEELQEMVCEACMNKAPFLWSYAAHIAAAPVIKVGHSGEELEVNVDELENQEDRKCEAFRNGGEGSSCQTLDKQPENRSAAFKRTHQEMTDSPVKTHGCRLKELPTGGPHRAREGAVFWPYNWRSKLCTCVSCKRAYVKAEVQFLLDESDTVLAYENSGRAQPLGEDRLMSFLSSLDHVQQLEMIYHYNDLKTELTTFLQQHAVEHKVVTAEDIEQFFEGLQSRKRGRPNAGY
ncbi:putative E3 ubiquitin-protein ligase UBR7 [Gadus chalcogrammus]|uniref:putative E3 ubiquitin-protein ligase UBR7 n=1 Tax=Gadus chalcogrammus TaxID=1042646 RepID=UPI0024C21943|nr:putative E3 ubiquitin-protein ligase UBR7 [Gadus chalcogrammus]